MTRNIQILRENKTKITIATDRITLRIHPLSDLALLPIYKLQRFLYLVDENLVHKNTLRGKLTLKNGEIKSKVLLNTKKSREAFTLIYNVEKEELNIFPEKNE